VGSFATIPPSIAWADKMFDGMMVCRAAVYKQGATGQVDAGGQPILAYAELVRDVPCFVRPEGGKELNVPPAPSSQTSIGIATYLIFMRPIQVDSPAIALNIHHWLQILSPDDVTDGVDYKDPNDPLAGAVLYNITNVNNPGFMDHHLEIAATVLEP
jgi:hypothetical protein